MFLEILAAILIFVGGAFAVGATFTMSGVRALKMGARWKGSIFVAIGLTLAAPSAAWFVAFFWAGLKGAMKLAST
jgi:hypothetical protein